MRAGRIVAIVAGILIALIGFGLTGAGATLIWANATLRDAAGYYTTPTAHLSTPTYAITGSVDLGTDQGQASVWVPIHPVGSVRIRADSASGPVFIGIAPTSDVDSWLAGVPRLEVTSIAAGPLHTVTGTTGGQRAPAPPASQSFWVAQATGPAPQTVVWPVATGRWTAVIMNTDGARGLTVDVSVGMQTDLLLPIGIGVGIAGLLALMVAALLLVVGLGGGREALASASGVPAPASAVPPGVATNAAAYPARLNGRIDPATSGWLWIVKWLLIIPHVFVLAVLWPVMILLTFLAGVAILVTGRYPRTIFAFNVGVVRWTWRVAFYAIGAFATDRYPPFSLDPDPSYPADFEVDHPEHLSRGLVLVKWWLLAIPQYIVVAFFAGGWDQYLPYPWRGLGAYGLIGVVALISAVILAVTGTYPAGTFDFLMGMNRWCFRVLTYAALMRDEYPPFRLDAGGTDPGSIPTPPAPPAPVPEGSRELAETAPRAP